MNVPKLLYCTLMSLLLFSCGGDTSENEKTEKLPNIHSIIFIDKTESVDASKPFVADKYQTALRQIIEENIRQAGDKLDVYFIHENTAKARTMSVVARSSLGRTEGMNATDLEAAETTFKLMLRKEQQIFTQRVLQQLMAENAGLSNQETNISASIPIISKAAATGTETHVYYFSDMVESVKSGRDFHKNPPRDDVQASEWAAADAENFKGTSLAGTKIIMILPFEPTSSSKENNPTVTAYWNTVFEELGVNGVEER